jgi:hypothetical protein
VKGWSFGFGALSSVPSFLINVILASFKDKTKEQQK